MSGELVHDNKQSNINLYWSLPLWGGQAHQNIGVENLLEGTESLP